MWKYLRLNWSPPNERKLIGEGEFINLDELAETELSPSTKVEIRQSIQNGPSNQLEATQQCISMPTKHDVALNELMGDTPFTTNRHQVVSTSGPFPKTKFDDVCDVDSPEMLWVGNEEGSDRGSFCVSPVQENYDYWSDGAEVAGGKLRTSDKDADH